MAASISGITQIATLNNTGWTAAAVATGTHAMPFVNGATFKLDGSTFGQEQGNAGTALVSGRVYSSYYMFATAGNGVDISADNAALQFHIADKAGGISVMANATDALEVYIFTGGSTSNYHSYDVEGRTIFKPGDFQPVQAGHRTPDATGGTPDLTDVTGIGVGFKSNVNGGEYGLSLGISQLIYWTGPVTFSDTNTDATNFSDYAALLDRYSGNTYHGLLTRQVGGTIEFCFPFKLTARNFSTTNDVTFRVDNAALKSFRDGYYSFEAEPPSGGSQTFTSSKISGNASVARLDFTLDAVGGGGTLTCSNISLAGARDVVIDGANSTVSGVFTDPEDVNFGDGDLDITVTESSNTNAIIWSADLVTGSALTTNRDINITFAETNLSDIAITLTASNTITFSPTTGSGTYNLSGLTTSGTVTLDNATANNTTVVLPAGTSYTVASPTAGGGSITVDSPAVVYTFNSDTASTLIRYFENDSQTVVDSVTGTTLDYEYPDTDPVDVEFVKQGYVPVNRQNVVPSDGGTLDIIMDLDEAYNASHGLTITSQYDYNRGTKVLTINSDQEALDVRSSLADVIRMDSGYYNTPLLMVAIPGLTRVDLTGGMTITSMATWKGAGMERFNSASAINPVEKWFAIKSVGNITGASAYYRQTSSGSATSVTLTNNVINEAFQYWSDPNYDGSTADGYDRSGYMVIKTFLAGTRQARVDVLANAGLSAIRSNLYTVPLANAAHDYAGTDPGISADLTLIAGGTEGGVAFAYEIVDGGTNSGSDIADQLHYNRITNPNGVIPGGTGLTWWEMPDMVIYNATSVETERGYREGATPTLVGFYVSRGGADHPDFTRFQGDNGSYYTPAVVNQATITNLLADDSDRRLYIRNLTTATTIYNGVPGTTYSATYTEGTDYTAGDQIAIRWAQANGTTDFKYFSTVVTAGSTGWSLDASNFIEENATYATLGVDGALVTGHTADYTDDEADLTAAANFNGENTQAWLLYILTTSQGIADFWGGYTIGTGYIQIHNAVVNMYLDNTTSTNIRETSNIKIFRDDGAFPVKGGGVTSGGGGISVRYLDPVYVVATGGSALTAGEKAQLSAIESKTAGLTYTVANKVDANTQYMNDAQVQGDGSIGDKWRGV